MIKPSRLLAAAALAAAAPALIGAGAAPAPMAPDLAAFRGLYKELVETNTTLSAGSCTLAAQRMAARLKAAGMTDDQLTLFATPEKPKEGGLVAVYPGTSKTLKPMLLLAHIDVVEANREDWTRDPFTLIEEDGKFFARGSLDDKAMAAVWVDTLVRFTRAGYKPARTIKLALTCGEETAGAFNGAEWLSTNRRDLIDAEFALNEGGGGRIDANGKLAVQNLQIGEKAVQNFRLTATNPGGHSSMPVRDNAIYSLSQALLKVRDYRFPLNFNPITRAYFAKAGAARADEIGKAMVALSANPADTAAEALVSTDRMYNSMLHTTCVGTMANAGHATNALPQRANANVNCRILPGETVESTRAALIAAIADPTISVEPIPPLRPLGKQPAMDPAIVGPVERLVKKHFPGVPLIPLMSTGGTDAIYLSSVGIPTYGVPGIWYGNDLNGAHGLNEFLHVRALYEGRAYLFDLVKALAE